MQSRTPVAQDVQSRAVRVDIGVVQLRQCSLASWAFCASDTSARRSWQVLLILDMDILAGTATGSWHLCRRRRMKAGKIRQAIVKTSEIGRAAPPALMGQAVQSWLLVGACGRS